MRKRIFINSVSYPLVGWTRHGEPVIGNEDWKPIAVLRLWGVSYSITDEPVTEGALTRTTPGEP